MSKINSFKDLIVWQKSMLLVKEVYEVSKTFPKSELYGLTSQIRRSAISIPSNIAEGSKRSTRKDYIYFLRTAFGSAAELETQVEIALMLKFINEGDKQHLINYLDEIQKMLNTLVNKLSLSNI